MKTSLSASLLSMVFLVQAAHAQFTYATNNGEISITGYDPTFSDVVIPRTIDGRTVTSIWLEAFFNDRSLVSVTIPNSVRFIGDYAFSSCMRLTSVTIPDGAIFGSFAFEGCTNLTNVTLPDTVTTIPDGAF